MLDILIKNGKCPDFETNSFFNANVGIEKGKITYLGSGEPEAEKVIEAGGRVVSPGFIDIHMHEENFSEGEKYIISKMMVLQGVTTCVGGNCGVMNQTVSDFKTVIDKLGGCPANYIMLSGYNYYRTGLGLGHYDHASQEQMESIRKSMKEDLAAGAFGISFGIEYDPGITFDEICYAMDVSDDDGLLVTAHYRSDCLGNIDSIKEMVQLQEKTDKKFQISHLSSCSALGQMENSLNYINEAMAKNPRLNFDTYPYNAFSTTLNSTVFDDGCFEAWGKTYSDVLITTEPYKNMVCTEEIFRDCRENYPETLAVAFVMNEDEIAAAIANPNGMVASDGILSKGNGHPRAAGTFPRLLGKYVREEKVISLIDALRKITLEPAKRLNLQGVKGEIKIGADGDITVFDPDTIIDGATFNDINIKPSGIEYVIVGGRLAVRDNDITDQKAGSFISYQNKQTK